jgi:MFS family permease
LSKPDTPVAAKFKSKEPGKTSRYEIFYGWWIVVAGTVIFIVSSGVVFYGNGVFLDPLIQTHGWSKGSVSFAVTLFFFTIGIIGLILGKKVDEYGPKPVLICGAIITGFALTLLSCINTIWQLYAVYLLLALGYGCTALLPINTLITNWFIRRRGLAMSITMTGLSIGGIIFVPFSTYLIAHWGLKTALPILGVIYCIVIVPISMFVIKQRPSDIGEMPDGDNNFVDENGKEPSLLYTSQTQTWTRVQAMRTMAFWSIVVAFLLSMTGQVAYLIHQMSFLSQTLGRTGAASAVSITAGASIIGRLLLGTVIDRMEKRYVIMILFIIQAVAVLSLAYSNHVAVLYIGTFAFGLTMGSILMMQSLITGECFGLVSFATVTGVSGVFILAGAALGPAIAGFIYDITQSYQIAFTIFAAASIVAVFAIIFAKPPKHI